MLFPASVATAIVRLPAPEMALFPEEEAAMIRALPKRRREFAGGRWCARQALAHLGIEAVAIPVGDGRAPLWPPGVAGSIAHSDTHAIAAVTREPAIRSLGVDLEPDTSLEEDLWMTICGPEELAWLSGQPAVERGRLARLLFSAKEAIYKATFPIDRIVRDFQSALVEVNRDGSAFTGTIMLPPEHAPASGTSARTCPPTPSPKGGRNSQHRRETRRPLPSGRGSGGRLHGRFEFAGGLILTGVVIWA